MSLHRPIRSIDYDPVTHWLTVRYQVGTHRYEKVPANKAAQLALELVSEAHDVALNYVHANIAGKYKSERIGD